MFLNAEEATTDWSKVIFSCTNCNHPDNMHSKEEFTECMKCWMEDNKNILGCYKSYNQVRKLYE